MRKFQVKKNQSCCVRYTPHPDSPVFNTVPLLLWLSQHTYPLFFLSYWSLDLRHWAPYSWILTTPSFYFLFFLFTWLHEVLVAACRILVMSCGSCLAAHGLSGRGAQAPKHTGSVVMACRLSCSVACGVLVSWPGIEPKPSALQGGFLTTGPPGKSRHSSWDGTASEPS